MRLILLQDRLNLHLARRNLCFFSQPHNLFRLLIAVLTSTALILPTPVLLPAQAESNQCSQGITTASIPNETEIAEVESILFENNRFISNSFGQQNSLADRLQVSNTTPSSSTKSFAEKHSDDLFVVYQSQSLDNSRLSIQKAVVNRESRTIMSFQEFEFTELNSQLVQLVVTIDDAKVWQGLIDPNSQISATTFDARQPTRATSLRVDYGTAYDACIRSVDSLCAVGGSIGGHTACVLLGLTTGIGGLGCTAVLGLIAMFGCNATKERVCSGASKDY